MKPKSFPRTSRQIRVVRVSRPSIVRAIEREHSTIPSAVDSWLSSMPSARAPIIKPTQVKKNHPPRISENSFVKEDKSRRVRKSCMIICAVVLTILLIGSIVGVILAVQLR